MGDNSPFPETFAAILIVHLLLRSNMDSVALPTLHMCNAARSSTCWANRYTIFTLCSSGVRAIRNEHNHAISVQNLRQQIDTPIHKRRAFSREEAQSSLYSEAHEHIVTRDYGAEAENRSFETSDRAMLCE